MNLVWGQVRVSLGHFDRAVAEKVANDQQRHPSHDQPRRARVAKVMDSEILDIGFGANGPKAFLNGGQGFGVVPWGREHPRRSRAVFRTPRRHCFKGFKCRRIQRNNAVLLGFGIFAFESNKTLHGTDTLQTERKQLVAPAAGVQCQLDESGKMRPCRHRLRDGNHPLRLTPRDPSGPSLRHWERHADEGIRKVQFVEEVVPVDRGAQIVQFAVDRRRAHAGCLSQGDVPLNGRPAQAAKGTAFEKAVQLELAVPESLRVFAGCLVGLHDGVVCRVFIDPAVLMDAMRGVTHALDRRMGRSGKVLSCCEIVVHVSGRPLRPGSVKVGDDQRPTFANIWQMMITY